MKPAFNLQPESARLDYLDAVRAFALLLGILFHASMSFVPFFMGWAVMDVSTSPLVSGFFLTSHSFRMELFFLIAGFFGRLTLTRKGTGSFLKSRCLRLVVPFVVGWFLLRPLIVSAWVMGGQSMRGDVDILAGLRGGIQSLASLPAGLFTSSHLWFIYYLAMITFAVVAIRAIAIRLGSPISRKLSTVDAGLVWLSQSRFALLTFALPTAAVLWFMDHWGVDTPDQSLRPHVPCLLLYGGFFVFGWLIQRNPSLLTAFARLTWTRLVVCVIAIAAVQKLVWLQTDPGLAYFMVARVGYALAYALMMWTLILLTIGVFERFCHQPNAGIRYVADSSYWLYLVHLPIVAWLQVAVAEVALPWWVKLPAVSLATILLALVTYDLFVRSTWIGHLINGRRRERLLFARATPQPAQERGLLAGRSPAVAELG